MSSIADQILYEDNHLIVVNKLPGQLVQPDNSGDFSLEEEIKKYIISNYDKPGNAFLGVVHRIDRRVSGAVIFAKTSKALVRLNEMLRNRQIEKTYWAIVRNAPPESSQILSNYLIRNAKINKSIISNISSKGALLAELKYTMLESAKTCHLLEIDLYTGRHHQIRAQLSFIGSPIKGDVKYGDNRSIEDGSICLHARKLKFVHPVKKTVIEIVAAVPENKWWNLFRSF